MQAALGSRIRNRLSCRIIVNGFALPLSGSQGATHPLLPMAGTLYLIPNTLGPQQPADVIPAPVLSITARLPYFVAENAKTTRAFLKLVHASHPLALPLQEIRIG